MLSFQRKYNIDYILSFVHVLPDAGSDVLSEADEPAFFGMADVVPVGHPQRIPSVGAFMKVGFHQQPGFSLT